MDDALAARRRERDRLIALAQTYLENLSSRVPVVAAAVVGSVARGDFNVWSDVDVLVVSDDLPERTPARGGLLALTAPPGVQAVGFTREEFAAALSKGNQLAKSVLEEGVILEGEGFFHGF